MRASIGSGSDYVTVCTRWTLDDLADVLVGLDVRDIMRAELVGEIAKGLTGATGSKPAAGGIKWA